MTSAELSEWMAFSRIEPLPDPYWGFAQVSAVIANVMGGGERQYGIEDFYPRTTAPEELSAEESVKLFTALVQAGFQLEGVTVED